MMMDGGSCVVIPVRPFKEGKSRLAGVLDNATRTVLNRQFFRHVLAVACGVVGPNRVIVISRAVDILDLAAAHGALPVIEMQTGLNEALEQATSVGWSRGATSVLTLSSDLPHLSGGDLLAMFEAGNAAEAVLAPDAAGTGTNALLFAAAARGTRYLYGGQSSMAHRRALLARGIAPEIVRLPGLANDIDTPSDLDMLSKRRLASILPTSQEPSSLSSRTDAGR